MKILPVCLSFLILCSSAPAQWYFQNPKPTGADILSMYFTGNENGFLGTNDGCVLRTQDGGENWEAAPINISRIYSIFFINNSTGWLAGSEGKIFKTINGGDTWEPVHDNSADNINCIRFFDESTGFAGTSSGTVLKTIDGGDSWETVIDIVSGDFTAMYFVNETGWICHEVGRIYKTTDGGETWVLSIVNRELGKVFFLDELTGFLCGYYTLLKTTNGGVSWETIGNGITNIYRKNVYFIDPLNGWVTTGSPGAVSETLFRTTDGGLTWNPQYNGIKWGFINEIMFTDDSTGYTAGSIGHVLRSEDRGNSWVLLTKGEREDIEGSAIIDENNLIAVGHNGLIFKTTDGGENWIKKDGGTIENLYSVCFVSKETGFIAGDGPILKTTDAGETWFPLGIASSFRNIYFLDEQTGWAAGWSGLLAKTTDGGNTWSMQTVHNWDLWGVYFISEETGFLPGPPGQILKTTDGGDIWNPCSFDTAGSGVVRAITFTSADTGYAGGMAIYPLGFIIKTTNGGDTWEKLTDSAFSFVSRIAFADSGYGFALISNQLYFTTDEGFNWKPAGSYGHTFSFASKEIIWTMSSKGIIRKTDNGVIITGLSPDNHSAAVSYILHQNYPNPFNSSTRIRYFLPHNAFVNITVYDVLGRRITELVNEEKPGGSYELTFDAGRLSSGVYLYRMNTGDFTANKKLLLIK